MIPDDPPPPALEERVVTELAERGLIARRRNRRAVIARFAATLAFATLAFALGRLSAPTVERAPAPETRRYLLLLREGPGFPHSPTADGPRVAEYARWARAEAAAGRLESGEKLGDESALAGAPPAPGDRLAGYFVVKAPDLAAATEIARRSPHVTHGGGIEVRPIVETP